MTKSVTMIREVQLSNFMSYRNASVPLEPGLNFIVGPNGAGKSSILLAISVVLGQAYTERARKLSELIRWGEKEARIGLKLDNKSMKGLRAFPQARTEEVLVTRVLKRNGDYHYLLNNKPIVKSDLVEGLKLIGLNPDNTLVIMHQLMVGRFASVSPVEKLLLLEDAISFGEYRREVIEASGRLQKLTTEREAMSSVLEGTRETYQHWQREYEKYEQKKKLEQQHRDLERELLWRRILRKEASQARIKTRISQVQGEIENTQTVFDASEKDEKQITEDLAINTRQLERLRQEQLKLEHERGYGSGSLFWIDRAEQLLQDQEKRVQSLREKISQSGDLSMESDISERLFAEVRNEKQKILETTKQYDAKSTSFQEDIKATLASVEKSTEELIRSRVQHEVSSYKLSALKDRLAELEDQVRLGMEEIEPLQSQAARLGPPVSNPREFQTLTLELAAVQERLKPLAHLSEEVEKMYRNYGDLYEGLQKKASVVEHNRTEVLEELRQRMDRWRTVMDKFLESLSESYDSLLREVGGRGRIVLKASKDIEKAGLELHAGFKGNEPVSLDGLSPSGGERTIALIAFLLSLQRFISSPFRAIDEFDVHMDPRNREVISRLIYAAARSTESNQYVAITPGQVTLPGEESLHVIVVQNVEGTSMVKELK